jgi:hypothetical protein
MNQPSQTLIDVGKDVRVGPHELPGILAIPTQAKGIVLSSPMEAEAAAQFTESVRRRGAL